MNNDDEDDDELDENNTDIRWYNGLITYEDVQFVSDLHMKYVTNCTRSEWLNPIDNNLQIDYVKPLLARYNLFKRLLNKTVHNLSYEMDPYLIGSLNILAKVAQNYGQTNAFGI